MEMFFTNPVILDPGVIIMTINEGDFIKISYTGKLEDGTIFDTTNEEVANVHNIYNPNGRYGGDVIIIGVNQMIAGLEEDIKEHEAGYEGTATIPPEKAFDVEVLAGKSTFPTTKSIPESLSTAIKSFTDKELFTAVQKALNKLYEHRIANIKSHRTVKTPYGIIGESEQMNNIFKLFMTFY